MAKKQLNISKLLENENIVIGDISQEIKNSMLSYSMLVILSRAIPDVLDGLKPAQRRILYSMLEQKHDYNKPFVKCAKISGEVMGNYHPHASCYGTIANMSQEWEFRYPLIDFHGCNGSISGDDPAADRYTEGRLHKISYALLEDVMNKESVKFKPNYSETLEEPVVLPGLLPNFLVNGCSGIAVGMTTESPSHNLTEVCDALIYFISHSDASLSDIMKIIKGPDLPNGACLSSETLKDLYSTGAAKVIFRANHVIETNHESGNPQIVFTDITPRMNIPKTLEKIYALIASKSLVKALGVRDESEGNNIRIVVECSKTANLGFITNIIYAKTDLQKVMSYTMRAIVNKTPKLITLMDYMNIYVANRRAVVKKRMGYLIDDESMKLEINRGIAKVMDKAKTMSKEIIDCEDDKAALDLLMTKYKLSELQANYILDKKIRSLVKKNIAAIKETIKNLEESVAYHKLVLSNSEELDKFIINELTELKKEFGDTRRTKIVKKFTEMSEEDNAAFVDAVLVQSPNAIRVYDKKDFDGSKLKDRTFIFKSYFECKVFDDVFVIFKNGEVSSIKVRDIESAKMKDVVSIIPTNLDKTLLTVLKNGEVKKTECSKLKAGKMLVKEMASEIVSNKLINDTEDEVITIATVNGYVARFSANSFSATGMGIKSKPSAKLEEGDYVVDCEVTSNKTNETDNLLILWANSDNTYSYKVEPAKEVLVKGRTSRALKHVFDKKFSSLLKVNVSKDVAFFDDKNNKINIKKFTLKHRLEKGDKIDQKPSTFNCVKIN